MSKKLGVILMVIGAYLVLLSGLFWVMHFTTPEMKELVKDSDWALGVGVAIVLIIGAVFGAMNYIMGYIGCGITVVGIGLGVWLLFYGIVQEQFLSPLLLIGLVCCLVGVIIALVFNTLRVIRISKHGNSMLDA